MTKLIGPFENFVNAPKKLGNYQGINERVPNILKEDSKENILICKGRRIRTNKYVKDTNSILNFFVRHK
jgi:hypothetical protein